MNLIQNEYRHNSNFRKYVDDYCAQKGLTVEDAFKEECVRRMFWRYTEV